MNTKQESKIDMCHAVVDYLLANLAKIKDLPNFNSNFETLKEYLKSLLQLSELQQFGKSGVVTTKNAIKDRLIALVADIARRLIVYAKFVNNAILLAEIKYPESELKHVSNSKLRDISQGVYDRAQENLASLGSYGINETTQCNQ